MLRLEEDSCYYDHDPQDPITEAPSCRQFKKAQIVRDDHSVPHVSQ